MRTGSEAAVCMRAISRGEVVRAVISQVPAVSCIQVPTDEMVEAIQRSRKRGILSGAKPCRGGEGSAASCWDSTGIVSSLRVGCFKRITMAAEGTRTQRIAGAVSGNSPIVR